MPASVERSYWACVFSVLHLLRGPEARTFWDPQAPTYAKLWTFTFPDVETRSDVLAALKKWEPLRKKMQKQGKRFVRSIEQGETGKGWHFHAVTDQYWDAREMWDLCAAYGFGRVDVKPIPLAAALYVAKYIRKRLKLPPGVRRWACVGFQGVPSARIKIRINVLHLVPNVSDCLRDSVRWVFPDNSQFTVKLREVPPGQIEQIHTMAIKPNAQKFADDEFHAGKAVRLGEYRGTSVKVVNVEDWKTKQTKEKVIVTHSVEFAGVAEKCEQWMPDGTKKDAIKAPAERGDAVLVYMESMSKKYGTGVTEIKSLNSLV